MNIDLSTFAVIDPSIKVFIEVVAFIAPISIVGVILVLKRIEKENPERIRWR